MKASSVVLCAIVALALVSLAHGLGTIYINKIRGNDDQLSVNIENVNFQANRVKLDRIFGLNSPGGKSEGTYIEDSQLVRGSFFIPRNLLVEKVATISGRLNFNGGLDADAVPLAGTSFKVADDSGITTVLGVTNPNGGIDVRKGAFVVENDTGRTTVAGLLRPNGDTLVKNTLFKVSAKDGSVTTLGEVDAQLDVILGTSVAESRYLTRVPSTSTANPGATGGERKLIIQGQNAINQGGNLVLEPGYSYGEHTPLSPGRVLLGRAAADSLLITRGAVAAAGGLTTFAAQSSSSHRGGDLIFSAGRSTAAAQTPANLLLQVGQNPISSLNGVIELGTSTGHDLNVRRVVLTSAINGKTTFLRGQAVSAPGAGGSGGKIVLRAGNAFTDKVPGNIVLAPGSATPGSRHRIRIGDSVPNADASWSTVTRGTDLWVTRDPVRSDAGQAPALTGASRTNFQGQHSLQGTGGSISFRAGDSALLRLDLAVFNGADLYLTNGKDSGPAPAARNLYWGRDTQDLNIRRYVNPKAAGTSTTIRGQIVTNVGAALRGGDFFLTSGTGATRSGDLLFRAPDSADTDLGLGGTISISTGSSVYLSAGGDSAGKVPNGGSVYIQAGTGVTAGDIELAAVTGTAIQTIAATDNQRVPNAAANQQSFTQTGVVAGTATFTGVVAVLGSSAFSLEEVDFQVTQTDSLTPSPIFSIHRTANAANRVFTNTPATNVNALNRPCNYRTAVADTGCTTVPALAAPVFPAPAVGDFYLQTTVPISTPTAFAATYTTVSAGNIANERIAPTTIGTAYPYHHVFRYTLIGGAPGTFDSILAPRYDGIAMQMNDQITANVYHLNALPRFSVLSPAIWRFTAWDPPVALANTQNVYATPTPDFQDTVGTDNAGIRVPPYNIRQNGGGARLTGFTDNAQPEGLGNGALGSLYSKSKTDRGFRGVIFDIAQNLNRVICALHNLGFIQAREVAWGGPAANNPVPGLIPIDQRCDPTPLRLLRYLNNNVAFYSPKFVAPVYTA